MRVWAVAALVLVLCPAALAAGEFRVDESQKDFITIYEGDTPVLRYARGEILAPGVPENRRRSTYIHPIWSVDGKRILTDDFPKDHYHHRGLSWMWLKVVCDGKQGDLWTLKGVHQRYVSHEINRINDSKGNVQLVVQNGWHEDSTGQKIIDETVTITPNRADSDSRSILLSLTLSAVDKPVTIGVSNTGYSGLNLRFAPRKDTAILTSEGPIKADENRLPHKWADLSGRFDDSADCEGIAIFDYPANPNFPAGWTLRFYGDLNPAFTSTATDYTIQTGKPLGLTYVIYVHNGKGSSDEMWKQFRLHTTPGPPNLP